MALSCGYILGALYLLITIISISSENLKYISICRYNDTRFCSMYNEQKLKIH